MRTGSWADAFAAALLCAGCARTPEPRPETAAAPTLVRAQSVGGQTRLELGSPGGTRYVLAVARDSTVAPAAPARGTRIVGARAGGVVVLTDSYPSVPGGMSYCQAGEEQFLRVIAIRNNRPEETFRIKVASCRDNLELADPGIVWTPDAATIQIRWLTGPSGGAETRNVQLGPEGRPRGT
jgi:hypothetical protein